MNPGGVSFSAILLAAGRSTRMGRDKALLEADGVPLWRRQRDVLRAAGAAEIFLSARDDQPWLPHASGFAAVLFDGVSVGGPIIGLTAGLERASHGHLAVLAIDLPRMSPAWFAALLADCTPGVGVVGKRGEFFEPLAAVYPKELMMSGWEALVRGDFSLQHFIAAAVAEGKLRVREIAAADAVLFENWNEPSAARPPPHA
ncbi:MAG: molybdenum cofactor guanylyltransferase [Verrucomicrobia bacterium]|nr:molybdenum cofactor guanylyltransferase [Verrucomicrobiota bacterium]